MAFEFTSENKKKFAAVLEHYPIKRAAMLPALWLAQEQQGWISLEVMEYIAKLLELSPAKVYEVVTFYTMFQQQPVGKYHLQVCRTLPCQLNGAEGITEHLKKRLKINIGETSADRKFTLSEVECLGSCGSAPMLQLNDDYHENFDIQALDKVLQERR